MTKLLCKDSSPLLLLAPMEGVGDRPFRAAMASVGGFDEACTEFIRVPTNAHVVSLAKVYDANETMPIPLAAQLMGSDPELMALMTKEMVKRGAKRVDLNCGCPSNTVTGRGAGSSLLKEPNHLYTVAKSMVDAVSIPVTLKLRSGFEDTSLFRENILAAQESGVKFITLHPRTKKDGYGPPANWDLIAEAKSLLKIPLIGNGDILTVADAHRMLRTTGCDGLMIGRGSIINPWIFHEIRASFSNTEVKRSWPALDLYIKKFVEKMPEDMSEKVRINKLKQIFSFLFKANKSLVECKEAILTFRPQTHTEFLQFCTPFFQKHWEESP